MFSLKDAKLETSNTHEDFLSKLREGKMDAAIEASSTLMTSAIQIFGIEFVKRKRCPVCAFSSVIEATTEIIKQRL